MRQKMHLLKNRRTCRELKDIAMKVEADARKYAEIRDNAGSATEKEFWRAIALSEHNHAKFLVNFADEHMDI